MIARLAGFIGLFLICALVFPWSPRPASADDNSIVCGDATTSYENGISQSQDRSEVVRFLGAVPQACNELRGRIERQLVQLRRRGELIGGAGGAGQRQVFDCAEANISQILQSNNQYVIELLGRQCPQARERATAWVRANGGRAAGPPRLYFNEPIQGQLLASSPTVNDDLHYQEYRVNLRPGDRIEVTVHGQASRMIVAIGTGRLPDEFRSLASREGSRERDARTSFTVGSDSQPAEYIVVVASREPGPYTIDLHQFRPPPPPPAQPLTVGQQVNGSLSADSPQDTEVGYGYQLWSFQGRAGQRVRIDMESDEFDTYVVLGRMEAGEFHQIAYDDDGGDSVNSMLMQQLDTDGEYLVRARAFGGGSTGAYTLSVNTVEPRTGERARVSGDTNAWVMRGSLTPTEASTDGGMDYYQDYVFPARRNRRYEASVHASFGAIVDVGALHGNEVQPVDFHDGNSSRPEDRVEFTAQGRDRMIVRVRAPSGRMGDYELVIREIPNVPPPPAPAPEAPPPASDPATPPPSNDQAEEPTQPPAGSAPN